jgi:hypothetical protein
MVSQRFTLTRETTLKKIFLVGICVGFIYLLFFSTASPAKEIPYVVDIIPTEESQRSRPQLLRELEATDEESVPALEPTTLPSSTQEPTPTAIPKERLVDVKIESSLFNSWYESFWEDELLIRIPDCSPNCSGDEILSELGHAFSNNDLWVTVQIGRFYYAHSGWDPTKGPDFGDPFKRAVNNESDMKVYIDEKWYEMTNFVHLSREEAGKPVFVNDIFASIEDDDIFIITCGSGILPNQVSPKIIVQLQPQN